MSLNAFTDAVRYHFTNSPDTWTVRKIDARRWSVINGAEATIESFGTLKAAITALSASPYLRIWNDRTAWYLGTSNDPRSRALNTEELQAIATVLIDLEHPAASAASHRAWPEAEFCDLCDLPLLGAARLCPNCDHCDTPGCREPLDDGEGFDGYCGNCADRREHSSEADDDHALAGQKNQPANGPTLP